MVSALEGAVLRLDRLTSIFKSAIPLAKDESTEDAANWLVPRANELRSAQNLVQVLNAQNSSSGSAPARVPVEDDPASLAVARSAKWLTELAGQGAAPPLAQNKLSKLNPDLFDEIAADQSRDRAAFILLPRAERTN